MNFNTLILTIFKCLFNKNYQKFILKNELSLKNTYKILTQMLRIWDINYSLPLHGQKEPY
jgi:hypothetical protein